MTTFSAPSAAIETPYPTAGTGTNPLFESIVDGSQIQDPSFHLEEWSGAQPQAEELFLSLYDLCHGDTALLDAIRGPEHTLPLAPTPVPNPVVGPPRVPTEGHAPPTPDTNPTLCKAPGSCSVLSSAVAHTPSQEAKASTPPSNPRYMPYAKAGQSEVLLQSRGTDKGRPSMRCHRQSQLRKKDYIKHHGVRSIKRLDGLETTDLNSTQAHGQWRELLVDTLEQIGLPYSVYGLKLLIARAYGLKIIRGQKKHPENRWQNHMSYHFCQYKKKTGASSQQADASGPLFVKLENERYMSTYWWLAGRPVPRHCEGFPEEAYSINHYYDEDSSCSLAEGT